MFPAPSTIKDLTHTAPGISGPPTYIEDFMASSEIGLLGLASVENITADESYRVGAGKTHVCHITTARGESSVSSSLTGPAAPYTGTASLCRHHTPSMRPSPRTALAHSQLCDGSPHCSLTTGLSASSPGDIGFVFPDWLFMLLPNTLVLLAVRLRSCFSLPVVLLALSPGPTHHLSRSRFSSPL